jgi:hypothetical protein
MATRTLANFTTLQEVTIDNMSATGDVQVSGELQLNNLAGTERVRFTAPDVLSSYTLTWPSDDGNTGQVLTTDGTGILSWSAGGGGGGGDISNGGNSGSLTIGSTDNSLTFLTNNVDAITIDAVGDLNMLTQNAIKFNDITGGEHVGLMAPSIVSSSYTVILPPAVGTVGQGLITTNGTGTMGWTNIGDISNGGDAGVLSIGSTDNSLTFLTNNIGAITIDATGDLNMLTQNAIKFNDTTGGEYVGIQSASSQNSSYILTLPVNPGTAGEVIINDGAGVLSWGGDSGVIYERVLYDTSTIQGSGITVSNNNTRVSMASQTGQRGLLIGNSLKWNDEVEIIWKVIAQSGAQWMTGLFKESTGLLTSIFSDIYALTNEPVAVSSSVFPTTTFLPLININSLVKMIMINGVITYYIDTGGGFIQHGSSHVLPQDDTYRIFVADRNTLLSSAVIDILSSTAPLKGNIKSVRYSSSFTELDTVLNDKHNIVEINNLGSVSVTIPLASSHGGHIFKIIKTGSTGVITLTTSGTDTINNSSTTSITLTSQYSHVKLVSGGSSIWYIDSDNTKNIRTDSNSGIINITSTDDHIIRFDTTSGAPTTINLPVSSTTPGQEYTFVKSNTPDGVLNITATGGDSIDGNLAFITLTSQYERIRLMSDGNGIWYTI